MTLKSLSQWRIITIDDNPSIHEDYKKVLVKEWQADALCETEAILFGDQPAAQADAFNRFQYDIDTAFQGQDGLQMIAQAIVENRPYSAALIDVRMPPGWDGVETAQRIWQVAPDLPIVLCTAYSDYGWEEITKRLPQTDQLLILKKPFEPFELRQIVASQVTRWHLNRLATQNLKISEAIIQQRTKQLESTQDLVFTALAKLAESRDTETGQHLERIEFYTRVIATRLSQSGPYASSVSLDDAETIARSSILHDIGKVGIPDHILLKPGKLTSEEFEIMKTHAVIGADALDDAASQSACSEFLATAAEIARYHHERFNGGGYPEGLSGEAIPLSARIVAVADVFDAITSARAYKKAICPFKAREIIESERGQHLDSIIVDAFVEQWDVILEKAREHEFALSKQ